LYPATALVLFLALASLVTNEVGLKLWSGSCPTPAVSELEIVDDRGTLGGGKAADKFAESSSHRVTGRAVGKRAEGGAGAKPIRAPRRKGSGKRAYAVRGDKLCAESGEGSRR